MDMREHRLKLLSSGIRRCVVISIQTSFMSNTIVYAAYIIKSILVVHEVLMITMQDARTVLQ